MSDRRFLPSALTDGGRWIEPDLYFASTIMFGDRPNLGFLKPMIRKAALDAAGTRYNPDLRIGEDDELMVRLMLGGWKYYLWPEPLYHYRKHNLSISHRLSLENAERMLRSEIQLRSELIAAGLADGAYTARWRSVRRAEAFTRSVEALKALRPFAAIAPLIKRPDAALLYSMPLRARARRIFRVR
jgi:succinoglycan biosynthesis protein ExoO